MVTTHWVTFFHSCSCSSCSLWGSHRYVLFVLVIFQVIPSFSWVLKPVVWELEPSHYTLVAHFFLAKLILFLFEKRKTVIDGSFNEVELLASTIISCNYKIINHPMAPSELGINYVIQLLLGECKEIIGWPWNIIGTVLYASLLEFK